jgi:hypothetical protein
MDVSDRLHFGFMEKTRKAFTFLNDLGFSEVEASPTLVRYRKDGVEVEVYFYQETYEIGADITAFGIRYALAEIIRISDTETAKQYHDAMASTAEGMIISLEELSSLMKRYGSVALSGDSNFFSTIDEKRKLWAEEYALDVLAGQLRPQAAEAFKRQDYSTAAKLYSRIRECLSPAEIKKLSTAEARSKD